jgi:hypothetical protein
MGNVVFLLAAGAVVCALVFRKQIVAWVKAKIAKKAE